MHRFRTVRRVVAPVSSACAMAAFAPAAEAGSACSAASVAPARDTLARAAGAVACEINRVRAARGLPRLDTDSRLATAAGRHARQMVRRRYFSHVSPNRGTVSERLRAAGYVTGDVQWAVGETLAWGSYRLAAPASVVAAWMDSPAHRRVLLAARYRDLGIGVAMGTPSTPPVGQGATYAAEFGVIAP